MKKLKTIAAQCAWSGLSFLITLIVFSGLLYFVLALQLPDVRVLKDVHLQVPLKVYTADNKLMAQYGTKRRIPVKLKEVPPFLVKAVLATEDARYYSHAGVDFIGLARAAKAVLHSGRKVQGASTITMQVARNFFLSRKKSYVRKVREILLALKIEKAFTKDKILELYLNKVYFGHRAYGVAAAAQVYYGKTLDQLTLPEMAMIAGLPQAPSRNNPIRSPDTALQRRNHVLARMLEVGFTDKATYEKAIQAPITAKYHGQTVEIVAPYVGEMVRQALLERYGEAAYESGFRVTTTLDSRLQMAATTSLQRGLMAYTRRHGYRGAEANWGAIPEDLSGWQSRLKKLPTVGVLEPAVVLSVSLQTAEVFLSDGSTVTLPWTGLSWARAALKEGRVAPRPKTAISILKRGDQVWLQKTPSGFYALTQLPKIQGAIIALRPEDGAIQALVGGFSHTLSNFNRATQAKRQPGSTFKPFIYSAALAKGYSLSHIINDAPVVMRDTGENQLWRPRNDNLKFYGPTRLRVGLMKSRNLVSVRLLQEVGVSYAREYAKKFGFKEADLPKTLSLALGSASITPLEIARGFSVFANGGYRVTPYFLVRIEDGSKNVLYAANPEQACLSCYKRTDAEEEAEVPSSVAPQVVAPQNVFLMTSALQSVIQKGTGRRARVLRRKDLSGKTGTTNDRMDAWFSGFNAQLEATVWVGYDDMKSINEYGSQAALPIWIAFMKTALKGMPESTLPEPAGIATVRIDAETGLLAHPGDRHAVFEFFREKNVPSRFSHVEVNDSDSDENALTASQAPSPTQPVAVSSSEDRPVSIAPAEREAPSLQNREDSPIF